MKKSVEYCDLMKMAEEYGIESNAMFQAAARQYAIQIKVIQSIETVLNKVDPVVKKSYVKEVENTYSHPMVRELPKHSDAANRTLQTMLDIIVKLGKKKEAKSSLDEMMDE